MQKNILLILVCLALVSATTIAGSGEKETEQNRQSEEKKVSKKSPETKAEKKLRFLLNKLPARYQFAVKALKLPESKIEYIVRKYLKHREETKSEYDDYRKQKQEIEDTLKKAERQKNWDKVRQLEKEKSYLCDKRYRVREKYFVKLQKQIMSTLNSGQRFRWPALLLAGSAMEPYRKVLNEAQIKKINRYCKAKAEKIAKLSFRERNKTKRKLTVMIENSILTKEQRKKLAEKCEEKSRKRKNRKKDCKEKEGGKKQDDNKKKPQETQKKKEKNDDDSEKVGGW
ncbi:MAG: hypothetical protein K8S55_13605 [Phycisphaerae bacterium]|nr:hypothetical protein [Phycisphaerae bacterium]